MVYKPNKLCLGKIKFLHTHHRVCKAAPPVPGQAGHGCSPTLDLFRCHLLSHLCFLHLISTPPGTKISGKSEFL